MNAARGVQVPAGGTGMLARAAAVLLLMPATTDCMELTCSAVARRPEPVGMRAVRALTRSAEATGPVPSGRRVEMARTESALASMPVPRGMRAFMAATVSALAAGPMPRLSDEVGPWNADRWGRFCWSCVMREMRESLLLRMAAVLALVVAATGTNAFESATIMAVLLDVAGFHCELMMPWDSLMASSIWGIVTSLVRWSLMDAASRFSDCATSAASWELLACRLVSFWLTSSAIFLSWLRL